MHICTYIDIFVVTLHLKVMDAHREHEMNKAEGQHSELYLQAEKELETARWMYCMQEKAMEKLMAKVKLEEKPFGESFTKIYAKLEKAWEKRGVKAAFKKEVQMPPLKRSHRQAMEDLTEGLKTGKMTEMMVEMKQSRFTTNMQILEERLQNNVVAKQLDRPWKVLEKKMEDEEEKKKMELRVEAMWCNVMKMQPDCGKHEKYGTGV